MALLEMAAEAAAAAGRHGAQSTPGVPEMPEMPGMARFTLGPDGTAVSITIDSLDANGLGTLTRVD